MSRLRPLNESECYARLYGGRESTVEVIREAGGERSEGGLLEDQLRRVVEERFGLHREQAPEEVEAA